MDLREVKDHKYVLQREILSLIHEFESDTQASVSSVDLTTTQDISGKRTIVGVRVTAEVP